MLTGKEAIRKIREIMDEGSSVEEEILSFLKKDLRQTMEDYHEAESSLKSLINDVFETVKGTDLKDKEQSLERMIAGSAKVMLASVKEISSDAFERALRLAEEAKEKFDHIIEKAGGIDKVEDEVKKEAEDVFRDLVETAEAGKTRLKEAGEAVREFAERNGKELSGEVQAGLEKSMKTAGQQIHEFEEKAGADIERLLHHSDEKTREWLEKIRTKRQEGGTSDAR